jgi:hypothetical protein
MAGSCGVPCEQQQQQRCVSCSPSSIAVAHAGTQLQHLAARSNGWCSDVPCMWQCTRCAAPGPRAWRCRWPWLPTPSMVSDHSPSYNCLIWCLWLTSRMLWQFWQPQQPWHVSRCTGGRMHAQADTSRAYAAALRPCRTASLTASLVCLHAVRSTYGPSNAIKPDMLNAFDDSE